MKLLDLQKQKSEHCSNQTEAPSINSVKNHLDKYWSDQDIVFNYKVKLNINRKSAAGRIYEDLETVAANSRNTLM